MFQVAEHWRKNHPDDGVGVMVLRNVLNPAHHDMLEKEKRILETNLRNRFSNRKEISEFYPIMVYNNYYKKYSKTYHVLQQLESIVLKGRNIPCAAGLVEAMFMAELKNGLLTAGHDFKSLKNPLILDSAMGEERYITINGTIQTAKPGDMMIRDGDGIISSVMYGPDSRTCITSGTQKVLFTVYAPAGLSDQSVLNHLYDVYSFVRLIAPDAEVELQEMVC